MTSITRDLILQIRKIVNFIVLEGESKECAHWRFKTPEIAKKSAAKIYEMYLIYRDKKDFIGMDMCRKFLEMGFTRSRRYANHRNGKKYDKEGNVIPQEKDHAIVAKSETYVKMRKQWRSEE